MTLLIFQPSPGVIGKSMNGTPTSRPWASRLSLVDTYTTMAGLGVKLVTTSAGANAAVNLTSTYRQKHHLTNSHKLMSLEATLRVAMLETGVGRKKRKRFARFVKRKVT